MIAAPEWLSAVVEEWRPRERLGGNEWAEKERWLSTDESAQAGRWRSVPFQREILDALANVLIVWLVIKKAAQVGVSELVRNAIGRWALLDPGDVLWVMTTQDAAEKAMRKLRAMFEATPSLKPLVSPDRSNNTLLEMRLTNGMRIVIGWAGSPQSLASDPFRRVILDECAKYEWAVKGEASAVDLAKERTKTFGRRGKIILLSSPKNEEDVICTSYREVQDRRVFAAPCPACGDVQPLDWDAARWPGPGGDPATAPTEALARLSAAHRIERDESAWIECRACKGKILPHLAQRDPRARWVAESDATPEPGERRRAYHVTELVHWETTITQLVVKFLQCLNPSALQNFYNGSLGSPKRASLTPIEAATFGNRAGHPRRLVPAWATTVLATADTQLRGWWYMIRAWGQGSRSRLLDWGWVESERALLDACVNVTFQIEGDPAARARPLLLAIDTGGGMETPDGSRTDAVYSLVTRTPGLYALKGERDREALQGSPTAPSRIRFDGGEVELHRVNKTYYADNLATLIRARDPILWEECESAETREYSSQMSSEEKVVEKSATGTKTLWKKKSKGRANHLWDCARYQLWASGIAEVEKRDRPTWTSRPTPPKAGPSAPREGGIRTSY